MTLLLRILSVVLLGGCPLLGQDEDPLACADNSDCAGGHICLDDRCTLALDSTASSGPAQSSGGSVSSGSTDVSSRTDSSSRSSPASSRASSSVMLPSSGGASSRPSSAGGSSSTAGVSSSAPRPSSAADPCALEGMACTTALPGRCAQGQQVCVMGALQCQSLVQPGQFAETCANAGVDDDCDGDAAELENGIPPGTGCEAEFFGPCVDAEGILGCSSGVLGCVPVHPRFPETCNNQGADDDCDGDPYEIDDGVRDQDVCVTGQPAPCSAGLWQCQSEATAVCVATDNTCPP